MSKTKMTAPTTDELTTERAKIMSALRHFQRAATNTETLRRQDSERLLRAEHNAKTAQPANVAGYEHDAKTARHEVAGCELFAEVMKDAEQRLRDRLQQINDTLRGVAAAN